jgi:hypothetical protein
MENIGELIWVAAYLVQMIALVAGAGSLMVIASAALAELIRRKVRASQLPALPVALRGQAERA